MKAISENTKVTLTIKQLKQLVKEAAGQEPDTQYQKCHKKEYSIEVYVPGPGTKVHNKLENSDYVTDEKKPFVLVGTAGEEWTVDAKKLAKTYTLDGKDIDDAAIQEISDGQKHTITTKADAGINWCKFIPKDIQCDVETSWGETLQANRAGIPHGDGDYIVTADDGGKPNLSDRWVVNGEIFAKTYKILGGEEAPEEGQLHVSENTKFTLTIGQLRKLVKEASLLDEEGDEAPANIGDNLEQEITKHIQDAAKKNGMEMSDEQTQQAVTGIKELLNNETLRYELTRMLARTGMGGAFGGGNFMASMVDKLYGKKKGDVERSFKDKAKEWFMGDEFEQAIRKKLLTDPSFMVALVKVFITKGADKKSLMVVCATFMNATMEVSKEQQAKAAE